MQNSRLNLKLKEVPKGMTQNKLSIFKLITKAGQQDAIAQALNKEILGKCKQMLVNDLQVQICSK
jgi:hypothetical protein